MDLCIGVLLLQQAPRQNKWPFVLKTGYKKLRKLCWNQCLVCGVLWYLQTDVWKIKCTVDYTDWHLYIQSIRSSELLTLNLLNFLNGIIHLQFLALPIIIFRDVKMKNWSWSANSNYRPWLDCTDGQVGLALYWSKRLIMFGSSRSRVKIIS